MKALVIGASGAIGRDLVNQLLKDDCFDSVALFVRRPLPLDSDKVHVHTVDFDHPDGWADLLTGDVLFSCMGTTIKAAGSQEGQWKVDYTYQLETARRARINAVPEYVLVSSIGASKESKFFYTKMKGALEDAVKELAFPKCAILQPPSLIRKGSDRFGEKAGVAILKALNAVGLFLAWKPMKTEEVASAMIRLAKSATNGTVTVTGQHILSV